MTRHAVPNATTRRSSKRLARRPPIRVLIADDHHLFLDGVAGLLKRQGFTIVGVALDGEEAVTIGRATHPDVALLDVVMPRRSGFDVARALVSDSPATAVVLVTARQDQAIVLEGIALGVLGFVVKTVAIEELVDAIRAVARGATYLSPAFEPAVRQALPCVPTAGRRPLTARELGVLRLVAAGQTNKAIATTLGISARTVDTHRTRLMRKLNVHDVAGLVRYAIREGIASA